MMLGRLRMRSVVRGIIRDPHRGCAMLNELHGNGGGCFFSYLKVHSNMLRICAIPYYTYYLLCLSFLN